MSISEYTHIHKNYLNSIGWLNCEWRAVGRCLCEWMLGVGVGVNASEWSAGGGCLRGS